MKKTPISAINLRYETLLVLFALSGIHSWQTCDLKSTRRTIRKTSRRTATPLQEAPTTNSDVNSKLMDEISASAFDVMAQRAALCLVESDLRGDKIGESTSANGWIHDASDFAMKQTLNSIQLKLPEQRMGLDRDEAASWIRWMKAVPSPLVIDLTSQFRSTVNSAVPGKTLDMISISRDDFVSRLGCRMILLPSGAELDNPLLEPTLGIIYGKLLYGGVSRYRRMGVSNSKAPPRKAGLQTSVKATSKDKVPVWVMYGGRERVYEAVDMGPAAVLEVIILPRQIRLNEDLGDSMVLDRVAWGASNIFDFIEEEKATGPSWAADQEDVDLNGSTPSFLSGIDRNKAFRTDFVSQVGGLRPQVDAIIRRVLDGRIIRPAEESTEKNGYPSMDDQQQHLFSATLEAEELKLLGLTPVRGLLMYGPPGCGKTALAREISRVLKAREPKIVSAPELLDRWVGGSEKLVRSLFADAEAELAACNGDSSKSALHVIVIDEIDAVFRKRSSAEDSGEATRSSVVNQILAKLDGVNSIPNVLLIGMTNRRELLDEALLRPGRLEVQIEIPLPDKEGRREILQIHFRPLRERGRLSKPLCMAIDGACVDKSSDGDNNEESKKGRKRKAMKRALKQVVDSFPLRQNYDLAAEYATGGFSGAEIAGLVRCAGSLALARSRKDGTGIDGLLITLDDVKQSLTEVKT